MEDFKVGVLLKAQRENKGLSFEQVYEITRISPDILKNIEKGKDLPAPVILKSFIKIYAKTLGMDEQILLKELSKKIEEPILQTPELEQKKPLSFPKKSFLYGLLFLGIYFLFFKDKTNDEEKSFSKEPVHNESSEEASIVEEAARPQLPSVPEKQESKTPFFSSVEKNLFKQELMIQSYEKGLMYFKLDDRKLVTQVLEPKKWYGFKALRKIYVRVHQKVPLNLIHNGEWKLKNSNQAFEQVFE